MRKPIAIIIGFAGKLPLAGMGLANIHSISGLQDLGYDVHYVERQNYPNQCYDPSTNEMTDDPGIAVRYLIDVFPKYGITPARISFIDRNNKCYGSGWKLLLSALDEAHFILNMGDATWFEELERCPNRAFIDVDPLFTQVDLLSKDSRMAEVLSHYDTFFTEGLRVGKVDCSVPLAGKKWIPVLSAIATRFWKVSKPGTQLPVTNLMNWESGSPLEFDGKTYGYKGQQFEAFIELPKKSKREFVLAAGGKLPRERLKKYGWKLIDPIEVTGTIEAYEKFISSSYCDIGIAKHAYVASKCGWFSDRSTCYLAAGRPVLHQDTGFGDVLPTGDGLFSFSTAEDVLEILAVLDADYEHHVRAARMIVEEYFEAKKVLSGLLDKAGYR
jgi:hypothetical protein